MLGFAGWYDNQPYRDILFYLPTQYMLWLGPIAFFYTQSLLNASFMFQRKHYWHFLPGAVYMLYNLVMFVTDQVILKKYYFLANGEDPDFDTWYQYVGFGSMLFYFFWSIRFYHIYRKMIVHVVSYAELLLFKWARNFLQAFFLMLLAQVLIHIATAIFPFTNNYIGSWWYFFTFSIIFYYIAITGYGNQVAPGISFRVNDLLYSKPTFLLEQEYPINQPVVKEPTDDAIFELIEPPNDETDFEPGFPVAEWKQKIEHLFTKEKIYEDPALNLTDLSKKLQLSSGQVSKIINKVFGANFNDFVNRFRVESMLEKLRKGEQKTQTLLGIAFDSGFNSKATFNRAFKKSTGLNPKEWMEKNL